MLKTLWNKLTKADEKAAKLEAERQAWREAARRKAIEDQIFIVNGALDLAA